MADIIQVDSSQYNIDHLAGETQAMHRDRSFFLLVVLAVFALVTAVAVGIYTRFFYDAAVSPFEVQTLVILQAVFGVLAIGLYITAVWRALNNVSLQARSGCPSCQQHQLMRVSRYRRDRLITLSGIRVGRYQCRQCHWTGRRIFRTNYHPLIRADVLDALDAAYVQPEVIPIAKPAAKPVQPESLPIDFNAESVTAGTMGEAEIVVDEIAVETVDFDLEIPGSDMAVSKTKSTQSPEGLEYSTNGATAPETLTEQVESASPIDADIDTDPGDLALDQNQVPNLGDRAKIVTTFGINLKADPHSDSKWVGLLGPGTIVSLHKSKKQVDGTLWYFVESEDQSGWVASSFLEPIK